MGEGFLGIVFEEINEGGGQFLTGLGLAVAFESMPVLGGDRQSFGQGLGQFCGGKFWVFNEGNGGGGKGNHGYSGNEDKI